MKPIKQLIFIILLFIAGTGSAQNLLQKNISLDVNRQRLGEVLEILSNKGNFYFSYNSNIIKKDSLVSFAVRNKTVKDVLDLLFNNTYEFRESGNYIIIRKAPLHVTLVTSKAVVTEKYYAVSGYVFDDQSGEAIHKASIYEKRLLVSALTNNSGFFKLKLKSSKTRTATLTVSKELYEDTSVVIQTMQNQELTIMLMPLEREADRVVISPADYLLPASEIKIRTLDTIRPAHPKDPARVEEKGIARFLLSAKQRVQTLNLKKFFTTRPFQVSLVPGLGSQGQMSSQVINKFSINVLGGYTAGTNGFEVGGLFNINKKGAQYFQAAGLFNVVGGPVKGFQVAGINNLVLDTVRAFQSAGVSNIVKGKFNGFQTAGVYNHVSDSVKGLQVAGVANFARRKLTGVQVAGVLNFSNKETDGVQIAGVLNYSKKLKGLQIGLINIADTSNGFSIGLINIVLKGYHKLSVYTNENTNVNAAFKTGNSKCYSILLAGVQTGTSDKLYTFGYGIGSELPLNKRKTITFNPELTAQQFYAGDWTPHNLNSRITALLNIKAGKYFSVYAGPAFNVLLSDQQTAVPGYRFPIQPAGYKTIAFSNRVTGWFGWSAGIHLF